MAKKTVAKAATNALEADEGAVIPRLKLGEQGFVGLNTRSGQIFAEANAAFRYPQFIKTVNEMRHNPTAGSAMNVYRMMISRVNWKIESDKNATEVDKQRAETFQTMMGDMEHSWRSFIEEVVPYLEYGFGIHEKVLRRRLKRNGSKFNDGLIGIKKLAPRNQDTIERWVFSEDGADLVGVEQSIRNLENSARYANLQNNHGLISIDRNKFLLFTASGNKGNPQGNSIYKAIYLAYKQLTLLQEQELIALSKDVQGILKIGLHPKYLDPNASAADLAVVAGFQAIIDNYNNGTQRGLLVPILRDSDNNDMFTYDLMEAKGTAKYNLEEIIKRLQTDILSALSVDVLKLGADGGGSFSLADAKTSVLALAIDYRLREIAEVLNNDLVPMIYAANGWSLENLPKFVYEDIEDINLESAGKFIQQVWSSGAIEADRTAMNRVRTIFGIPELDDETPVDKDKLPANMGMDNSGGQGMAPGTNGNGTSKNSSGAKDSSTANNNNK